MSEHSIMSLRCLVLDDSVIYTDAVKKMLSHEPGFEVHTTRTGFGEGLRAARKLHPDIILVAGDTPGVASVVESLDGALPEALIIVLFSVEEPEIAQECLLAGAQLCLYDLEDREQFIAAIRRLVTREKRRRSQIVQRASGEEQKLARVLVFHSAKGGSGTTTMAVNAAIALAKHSKKKVVLIDGALQSGDVGVMMDINHTSNITDLLPHIKQLDEDLVREVMAPHASGVQVLLAPPEIERAELVSTEIFTKILAVLRKSADYIIIDTPPVLDEISMAALDASSQIVLVSTPEVAGLRNTARFLQLTSKLGYSSEKVLLLLNRAGSKGAVRNEDIKQHLKHEIGMQVKSAGRNMVSAGNKGAPVAMTGGRFGPAKSFRQLAAILDASERTAKREERAKRAAWLRSGRKADKAEAAPQNV